MWHVVGPDGRVVWRDVPVMPTRAAIISARRAALADAIDAVQAERVDAQATEEPTDIAYNRALDHAIEAIRALVLK